MLGISDLLAYSEAKDHATCVDILGRLMREHGISAQGRSTKLLTIPADKVRGGVDLEAFPVVLARVGWDADLQAKANYQYRNVYVTRDGVALVPYDIRPRRHALGLGGSWCWFQRERALYDPTTDRTYYNTINYDRQVMTEIDHGQDTIKFVDHHVELESDDHNNGSCIIKQSDRKLLTAYSNHGQANWWTRQSSKSVDAGDWDFENDWDAPIAYDTNPIISAYTYQSIFQQDAPVGDPIYIFYRTETGGLTGAGMGINQWVFSKANDGPSPDFDNMTSLYQGTDTNEHLPYVIPRKFKEDRLDFLVCSMHPDRVHNIGAFDGQPGTRIGHFFLDTTNDTPYKLAAGGPQALTLPVTAADLDFVTPTRGRYWCNDLAQDIDGDVWLAYTSMVCPENRTWPVGDTSRSGPHIDQTVYTAKWSGIDWETNQVVRSGDGIETWYGTNMSYTGEAIFDFDDPRRMFAGVEVMRDGGPAMVGQRGNARNFSVYEIQEFYFESGWAKVADVTVGSETEGEQSLSPSTPNHRCRPYVVPGQPKDKKGWLSWYALGKYESYAQHCTSIEVWPHDFDVLVNSKLLTSEDNVFYLHYGEARDYQRDPAGVWNDDYRFVAFSTFAIDQKPGLFRNLVTGQTALPAGQYDDFKELTDFGELARVDSLHLRPNFVHSEGNAPNMRGWSRLTFEGVYQLTSVPSFGQTTNYQAGDGTDGASMQYYVQTDGYSPPRAVGGSLRTEGGGVRQYNDNVLVAALDAPQYHALMFRGTEVAVQIDATVDIDDFTFGAITLMDEDSARDFLVAHLMQGHYGWQLISDVERSDDWRETFRQSWIDANFFTKSGEYAG